MADGKTARKCPLCGRETTTSICGNCACARDAAGLPCPAPDDLAGGDALAGESTAMFAAQVAAHDSTVFDDVAVERARQDARWGVSNHPDGTGPTWSAPNDWLAPAVARARVRTASRTNVLALALIEEVAEAVASTDVVVLREKLINVAAVAVAWVEAIDRRSKGPGRCG